MKATVVEIQSRMYYTLKTPHPHRVIALQFDTPLVAGGPVIVRFPEDSLGVKDIALDDEVEVIFAVSHRTSETKT